MCDCFYQGSVFLRVDGGDIFLFFKIRFFFNLCFSCLITSYNTCDVSGYYDMDAGDTCFTVFFFSSVWFLVISWVKFGFCRRETTDLVGAPGNSAVYRHVV